MAKKKYIKDSRGMTVAVTTDTLGLEKPLLNENYDIDVHNRNMDKIDEDLKPIDDSYIIELFQHDGDTTNPRDYYTKAEADEKFASKEEANNALNKANEAFQRGDNVIAQLVDKLISEGLNVSTDNTFEELIGGIALGKKFASGSSTADSQSKIFNMVNKNAEQYFYYFNIPKLNFAPNHIIFVGLGSGGFGFLTNIKTAYSNEGTKIVLYSEYYNDSMSSTGREWMIYANNKVFNSDGTISIPSTPSSYSWIAFE